jgi:hypothetical protein
MKWVLKKATGQAIGAGAPKAPQTMKQYAYSWVVRWCAENGWTDLFIERYRYWAFPPGAVMPQPIPSQVLQCLHDEHGSSPIEQRWYGAMLAASAIGGLLSCWSHCPLPLLAGFGICAMAVAYLEEDDLLSP